jgi:hypothetical protein
MRSSSVKRAPPTSAARSGRSASYDPAHGGRSAPFRAQAPGGRTRTAHSQVSSAVKPDTTGEPVFMPDFL